MSRSHGFLAEAVKEIRSRPGQSAKEIAERLLADGRATSSARDPVASLVATLHKHHPGTSVRRQKRGGQFKFFPESESDEGEDAVSMPSVESRVDQDLTVALPSDCIEFIDALVILRQFTTRHEAAVWLIRKGMTSAEVT